MGYGRLLWLVLVWVSPIWGELPLPAPEVRLPRVVSKGEEGAVPQLPWRWMTWNLQWFPGHHPRAVSVIQQRHILSVGEMIEKTWPQVALLQEVLDGAALRRASPAYPWRVMTDFQRAGDEDDKLPTQNIALISQWPWSEVWEVDFYHLPLTVERPVRGFLGVKLQDDQGRSITVYGVHLKSNRGGRDGSAKRREKAVDYLRWDWCRRGLNPLKDAILLGGDFNCSVRNPEFTEETIRSLMREGWILADGGLTWPEGVTIKPDPAGRFAASDFDHFLLSPGWRHAFGMNKQRIRVISGENIPSDHYPVELILAQDCKETSRPPLNR